MAEFRDKRLETLDELKNIINDFRRKYRNYNTNYVPNALKYTKWINAKTATINYSKNNIYLLNDASFMLEAIYFSTDDDTIINDLQYIADTKNKVVVLERVFKPKIAKYIGIPDYELNRMSCQKPAISESHSDDDITYAVLDDTNNIRKIFDNYFNKYIEQIPTDEELTSLINNNCILLIKHDITIIGLCIYEHIGCNMYLRYWWVNQNFRGKGIGGRLLNTFFTIKPDIKRYILWVFSDNENAISKYKHYGFEFDGTSDEIYCIKPSSLTGDINLSQPSHLKSN